MRTKPQTSEMSDLEISQQLALAIGWVEADSYPLPKVLSPEVLWIMRDDHTWCVFDYRDWNVIGPIAERYFAFPAPYVDNQGKVVAWEANTYRESTGRWYNLVKAETPQKAIALTVIASAASTPQPPAPPTIQQ